MSNLAYKQGWAAKRRQAESLAIAGAEIQAAQAISSAIESIAIRSEELTERGFDLAEQAADECDCKGFAMAAKGAQIFNGLFRQAHGLDAKQAGEASASLTLVYAEFQPRGEKKVTDSSAESDALEFE